MHPSLSSASRIQRVATVSAAIDGELVMLDIEAGRYFGLDDIGSYIWELIERETSVGELIADLAGRYDAPTDTIERDVLGLLRQLQEQRLLRVA